ncbi:hypothetical protein [Amorphus coralli]|uniref:hypothetical protein n=1 Tax=Amorphus coralli TaxID=340680 RepID=UPI000409CB4C|nr:hypothetical protein [Amorphus coralli]
MAEVRNLRARRADEPRIYDCFLFFRELDLLEIRLTELYPVVDTFVIVEARRDFAGNEKPLVFKANRNRFAAFADKIRHVEVLDEPENAEQRWVRQAHQRRAMMTGLEDARPNDFIMVSDLDEIPSAKTVERLKRERRTDTVHFFNQPLHRFYLDIRDSGGAGWTGTRAVRKRAMIDPTRLRKLKPRNYPGAPRAYESLYWAYRSWSEFGSFTRRVWYPEAGWHFSSLGDDDYLAAKDVAIIYDETSGHTRMTADDWHRERERLVMTLGEPEWVEDRRALPRAVREDPERYARYFHPGGPPFG